MARIFEALKHAQVREERSEDEPAVVVPFKALARAEAPAAAEEEVPFIEVGPRGSPPEASPQVLASGPLAGVRARTFGPAGVEFWPLPPGGPSGMPGQFAPELFAFHQPDHPLSQQYRVLWAGLRGSLPAGPAALLFAAGRDRKDAHVVLLNLAITAAREGTHKVAILDASPVESGMAALLGLAPSPGRRELLNLAVSLRQALRPTAQANLLAVTAGGPFPGEEPATAEAQGRLVNQLRKACGLVFVAGPPLEDGCDLAELAAACQALYLVVGPETAAAQDDVVRPLVQQGCPVRGLVVMQGS